MTSLRRLLPLALLLLPVPSAGAATVTSSFYETDCSRYGCASTTTVLAFSAAPGEANRLTVTRSADAVTFVDTAAPVRWIEQGPGTRGNPRACTQVDDHTVRCLLDTPQIDLGDGDDEATGDLGRVNGGAGADRLTGGSGAEVLDGGEGADVVSGGGGDDTLLGGVAGDADRLDGGDGIDVADYASRRTGVRIDLAGGSSGQPGEGDTIAAVEAAVGGSGDDSIRGGPGPDRLRGRGGADRVTGGGGRDRIDGGAGGDRLNGGAGDDLIDAGHRDEFGEDLEGSTEEIVDRDPDTHADRVTCGGGRDRVTWASGRDRVQRACERIVFQDGGDDYTETDSETYLARPVRVTRDGLVVQVGCLGDRCQGVTVAVAVAGRLAGRSRRRAVPGGRTRRFFVPAQRLAPSFDVVVRAVQGRGAVRLVP